jgi:hypothetical protein
VVSLLNSILSDRQIAPSIAIVIASQPLFAVNLNAACGPGADSVCPAISFSNKLRPASHRDSNPPPQKILAEKQIFCSIAVQIADANPKGGNNKPPTARVSLRIFHSARRSSTPGVAFPLTPAENSQEFPGLAAISRGWQSAPEEMAAGRANHVGGPSFPISERTEPPAAEALLPSKSPKKPSVDAHDSPAPGCSNPN